MDTNSYLGEETTPLKEPSSDEKTLAILSHILALVTGFVAPLIIYALKKDESQYVADHAKESLNFQITMFILYCVSFVLIIVLVGALMVWALSVVDIALVIIATIKASENKMYRYPFNLRLIK